VSLGLGLLLVLCVSIVFALFAGERAQLELPAGLPTTMRGRSSQLGLFILRAGLRRAWLSLQSALSTRSQQQALRERYQMQVAEEATKTMGNMKGAFMKLGQILSFAAEVVPENARQALGKLQMDVAPMAFSLARSVIEEDLGRPLEQIFARFDEHPIAAASIGQVHRAQLASGEEVAVKVQYPGVGAAIAADLKASRGLAAMVAAMNQNIDAHGVVDEIKARLAEELDYAQELRHQTLFHELWQGHPLIRVPKPYPELSGTRVLTQEYFRGLSFERFLRVATPGEKRLAVYVIHDFVFDSMYGYGVFNGDPHPGNYLFQEDGGVVFLDFGCVKRFPPGFLASLSALNRALIEGDRAAFMALLVEMQVVLPGKEHDPDELWAFFSYHTEPFRTDQVFTFTKSWVAEAFSVMDPTKQTRINLPRDFVFLNRITFGLNSILLMLGASENFHRMHRRYHYPAEGRGPALAQLGVALPERFLPVPKPVAAE